MKPYLYGIVKSYDAAITHFRRNPEGRAYFAPGLRCLGSTTRRGVDIALVPWSGAKPTPSRPAGLFG